MAQKDMHMIKQLEFIRKAELDDQILTLNVEGKVYTVMLADEYPRGESMIFGDDCETLLPGDLESVAYQVLQFHQTGGGQGGSDDDGAYGGAYGGGMSRENTNQGFGPQLDPLLSADMKHYSDLYGSTSVEVRSLDSSDWVTIFVPVDGLVSNHVAQAWGMDREVPISIRLKFDTKSYIDQRSPPRIEMFQGDEKFALGQQMTRVLAGYLQMHWKGHKWAAPKETGDPRVKPRTISPAPLESKEKHLQSELKTHQVDIFSTLMEMEFDEDFAWAAAANSDTVEEAVEYDASKAKAKSSGSKSTPPGGSRSSNWNDTNATKAAFADPSSTVYDVRKDPGKIILFNKKNGFLAHMADVLYKRIPTCSKYCVICDKPHLFGAGGMIRPAVCTRDVCVFAFQELSVGGDSAESVATDAGVIDLLVSVFRLAAYSARAEQILTPYPMVPDPNNKNKMLFDPAKKDFDRLKQVLLQFPSVKQVVQSEDLASLKARLTVAEPAAYPLLEWVINSNRSHIVKMHDNQHLKAMNTPHQFLLITAPPEKQKSFEEKKKKHGTTFAFHGSGAENWHVILRGGLKNVSGTKLQVNGAAHGAGIYFAPEAQTSIGYCRTGTAPKSSGKSGAEADLGKNFISESTMICMALCEIVKTAIHDHGWCWTVQDEDAVMTRFFFVYEHGSAQSSASTKTGTFVEKEVKPSLKFHGLE